MDSLRLDEVVSQLLAQSPPRGVRIHESPVECDLGSALTNEGRAKAWIVADLEMTSLGQVTCVYADGVHPQPTLTWAYAVPDRGYFVGSWVERRLFQAANELARLSGP